MAVYLATYCEIIMLIYWL